MRIDCQTYGHWKDLLICSLSCPYTFRCKQFKKWKQDDDNAEALQARVMDYITRHPNHPYQVVVTPLPPHKQPKKDDVMKRFVCISEEDVAILSEEEITSSLLQGVMFDEIYELGRAMELQIRLVPTKAKKTKTTKSKAQKDVEEEEIDVEVEEEKATAKNGASKSSRGRRKKSQAAVN